MFRRSARAVVGRTASNPPCRFRNLSESAHDAHVIFNNRLGQDEFDDVVLTKDPSLLTRFWLTYQRLAEKFSCRNLTVLGDAYDAFSGITNDMRTITEFLWALPCARFELSLAWNTLSRNIRRRVECSTLPMTSLEQQAVFHSWSWLGWVGGVFISVADDTLET